MTKRYKTLPKYWKVWETLLYLSIASILLSLSTRFFINIAGTFTPGVAGVAQGITYTLWNLISKGTNQALGMTYSQFVNNFFVLINWTLNIPIIIFSFRMVGKKFSIYSLYVMINTIIITLLISNLPGMKGIFSGQYIQQLKHSSDSRDLMLQYSILTLVGLFGGLSYGFGCGLIFKAGYSTMGFDPVAKYLEINKSININKTLFIFSMLSSFFWIFICSLTSGQISDLNSLITSTILSPTSATTIIFIAAYAWSSNETYPSLKKVSIEIISKEYEIVAEKLINDKLIKVHTIRNLTSGYLREEIKSIVIITEYSNSEYLIKIIRELDPQSIIAVQKLETAFLNVQLS